LRVKSDGAWTSTSSPTAFEFQTCPSGSESPQTRLVIGSTGDVTVNESVAIGTSPTAGISLNVRENSTTTAADIRNANASGFGLYVAGGSSSSEYAFRAANKDNAALFTVRGDGLAEFSGGITVSGGVTSLGSFTNLDISSGAITITSSTHKVDTEGGAATDDLDTINGGTDGSILVIQSNNNDRDVSAKDGTGNLQLAGNYDLNHSSRKLTLIKSGSVWYELSRSSNI
jgi:hypothetical protein